MRLLLLQSDFGVIAVNLTPEQEAKYLRCGQHVAEVLQEVVPDGWSVDDITGSQLLRHLLLWDSANKFSVPLTEVYSIVPSVQ